MNRQTVAALAGGFFLLASTTLLLALQEKKTRRRRYKVRPINRQRKTLGFYQATFIPMKLIDPEQFFKYTRMDVATFDKFCGLIKPHMQRHRILPDTVTFEERVAITLHYLSQGSSMQTIAWKYQVGLATVHKIISEVCDIIWSGLSPTYLKPPQTPEQWTAIADEFFKKWNFPNCIGAIDGKHITIQAPAKSGSLYFNYKKTFSVVLLACADANYRFVLVDIGAYGSASDGGIFRDSVFGQNFDQSEMHVPPPGKIPGTNIVVPYVLVADEAFPLKTYIMRPFPGRNLAVDRRIFNYRLSRARRIIENTFGILTARWRILRTSIIANVSTIDKIVKSVVCLHNFLQIENAKQYCPRGYVDSGDEPDGQWREETNELSSVGRLAANVATRSSNDIRNILKDYFMSERGAVPWQLERVFEGREPDL